jgi:uncharacterized C2H2 Zn-finger protein
MYACPKCGALYKNATALTLHIAFCKEIGK